MDYGGIPADASMIPPQNGMVDGSLMPPQNGIIEANGEILAQPNGVEAYQYEQPGPTIDAEYTEIHTVMADGGDRFAVSAIAFDRQEELIWMGNQGGHLTSYYGLGMQKYTSFQVHPTNEIRQILTTEGRVLSLTSDNLRVSTKFGRRVFDYSGEQVQDMQCMLLTPSNTLMMGGHRNVVTEYDLQAQQEVKQVEISDPGCAIMKYSHGYLCAGDTGGNITLRDTNTLKAEHVLDAHSGTLSDFDVHGNQLITCGFGSRRGNMVVDHFLMVYDLRMIRAIAPIQVAIDPIFLKIVPTYSDRICVVSQTGQFQLLEQGAMTPASMVMYQVNTEGAMITSFDISDTHNCMTFGDSGGFLHLFSTSSENVTYNQFSVETEFATIPEVLQPINVNDMLTPLSIIPMQYPTGGQRLISDWPEELCVRAYRQSKPVENDILRSMKVVQNVGYAPNPATRRRNQVNYQTSFSPSNKKKGKNVPSSPIGRGKNALDSSDDTLLKTAETENSITYEEMAGEQCPSNAVPNARDVLTHVCGVMDITLSDIQNTPASSLTSSSFNKSSLWSLDPDYIETQIPHIIRPSSTSFYNLIPSTAFVCNPTSTVAFESATLTVPGIGEGLGRALRGQRYSSEVEGVGRKITGSSSEPWIDSKDAPVQGTTEAKRPE